MNGPPGDIALRVVKKKQFSNHFQLTSLVNVVLEMKPMMKFLTQYLYLTMLGTN
jgi:hypothetical protein